MDKDQEPSNPECYTPSSEPFRIYAVNTLSKVRVNSFTSVASHVYLQTITESTQQKKIM
jgi:hypothetical protein